MSNVNLFYFEGQLIKEDCWNIEAIKIDKINPRFSPCYICDTTLKIGVLITHPFEKRFYDHSCAKKMFDGVFFSKVKTYLTQLRDLRHFRKTQRLHYFGDFLTDLKNKAMIEICDQDTIKHYNEIIARGTHRSPKTSGEQDAIFILTVEKIVFKHLTLGSVHWTERITAEEYDDLLKKINYNRNIIKSNREQKQDISKNEENYSFLEELQEIFDDTRDNTISSLDSYLLNFDVGKELNQWLESEKIQDVLMSQDSMKKLDSINNNNLSTAHLEYEIMPLSKDEENNNVETSLDSYLLNFDFADELNQWLRPEEIQNIPLPRLQDSMKKLDSINNNNQSTAHLEHEIIILSDDEENNNAETSSRSEIIILSDDDDNTEPGRFNSNQGQQNQQNVNISLTPVNLTVNIFPSLHQLIPESSFWHSNLRPLQIPITADRIINSHNNNAIPNRSARSCQSTMRQQREYHPYSQDANRFTINEWNVIACKTQIAFTHYPKCYNCSSAYRLGFLFENKANATARRFYDTTCLKKMFGQEIVAQLWQDHSCKWLPF